MKRIWRILITASLGILSVFLSSFYNYNYTPAPVPITPGEGVNIRSAPDNLHIVFVNGLGCSFEGSRDEAMGFQRIRMSLAQAGFKYRDERFLLYSYTGGKAAEGKWFPAHYSSRDTGQSLCTSVNRLYDLIEDYSQARPEARYILVGHSLGGRIALDYISTTDPAQREKIIGVITLNSPLLGVEGRVPFPLLKILDRWGSIWASTAVQELLWEYPRSQEFASLRQSTIRSLRRQGVRVATFATHQDFLVSPKTGCLLDEKGGPLTEGAVINVDKNILRDISRHLQIMDHQDVCSYIAGLVED